LKPSSLKEGFFFAVLVGGLQQKYNSFSGSQSGTARLAW
jgi:hypothetical protein